MSFSSPLLSLLLCFLLSSADAAATNPKSKSHIYPLKTQKISLRPAASNSKPLLFRHNVSLTVSLSVGSPPQNVTMVLDTGSELSYLLCSDQSQPSNYNPALSSSFDPIPCSSPSCRPKSCDPQNRCHVALSYADASTAEGFLASEEFTLGAPARAAFGCATSSYSSSPGDPGSAGLLGMNRGELSFVTQTGTRRFAYCISSRDSSGLLVLGGARPGSLPQLNYTALLPPPEFPLPYFDRVAYSVRLEGIRVGSTVLQIPKSVLEPDHTGAGQTMVDSGSQFTFLLGPAYDLLKAEFLKQTERVLAPLDEPDFVFQGALDTCYRIPFRSPAVGLPEVVLMFEGAEVAVGGERLLYRVAGEVRGGRDAVWCLTFGNSDLAGIEAYVIGHHHQQDVWVEYDLENERVGFAPVHCDVASRRLGLTL